VSKIEIAELYRGVGIHDSQPPVRITLVKAEIDRLFDVLADDVDQLTKYCFCIANPPEARLLAAAILRGHFDEATDQRWRRPDVDLRRIDAAVSGLDDASWRDPDFYGSDLDLEQPGKPGKVPREVPLEDTI
jgi:hypothetical protein